jgi:hypothetical protein
MYNCSSPRLLHSGRTVASHPKVKGLSPVTAAVFGNLGQLDLNPRTWDPKSIDVPLIFFGSVGKKFQDQRP